MSTGWRSIYSILLFSIVVIKIGGKLSDSSLKFLHSKQKFEILPGGQVSLSCRIEDGSVKVFLRHRFTPDTPEYRVHINAKVVQLGQDFVIKNIGYHDNGVYYCLAVLPDGRQAKKEIAELVVINQPRNIQKPELHSLLLGCIGGLVVGFFVAFLITILLILKQKGIIFRSLTQRIKEEAEKTAKQFKRGRRTTKSGSIWDWHEDEPMSSETEEEVTDYNDLPFIIRHSKIKEQIKSKPGNGFGTTSTANSNYAPPVPQTPRPSSKMAGLSRPPVRQMLLSPVPETLRPGTIAGPFQSLVPESHGMILAPPQPPLLQIPRPGPSIAGSEQLLKYHESGADDGSDAEHSFDQVPTEDVIYENIDDMNLSSGEN